jgi:hypothetical protein
MGSIQCCNPFRVSGKIVYENIVEGVTFKVESDEQTGYHDKVVIETRQKAKNPSIKIMSDDNMVIKYMIFRLVHISLLKKDSQ